MNRLAILAFLGALSMSTATLAAAPTRGSPPTADESFAFLEGSWNVHHRMLKEPMGEEWVEFAGSARFFTILDGIASVEELRDAKGQPFGGAMRTFDRETRRWADRWVPARAGVLQEPQYGTVANGVGIFESPDNYDGKPILARGTWRVVTKDEITWDQAISFDEGKSWKTTWLMRFVRAGN